MNYWQIRLNAQKARAAARKRKQTRLGLLVGGLLATAAGTAGYRTHTAMARKANFMKNLKPHPGGLVYNNGKWSNSTKIFTSANNRPFLVRGNNVYSLKAGGFDPHAWTPTFKVGNKKETF
jgi:hypothetical protein